jgi:hypothetical protein
MSFNAANHFTIVGPAVEGSLDTSGISGGPVAAVTVDGRKLTAPRVATLREGVVIQGIHEEVADGHTREVVITVPNVNLDESEVVTCAGLLLLVTMRTSIGGPGLVRGPLQDYELRPLAVTAAFVVS